MQANKNYFRFEIKQITEDGSFEGMLSPYGNVDSTGDVVEPGAFTKTLKDHGNTVPMLWQHSPSCPIGTLTLEDRPEGLWCKGQLLMADAMAQRAYLFVKAKIVRGLSIGFTSIRDAIENGVRHLKEVRLYEGSVVTFPANDFALIASVKGAIEQKGDFNEELTEIQLSDAGYQMRSALSSALYEAVWSDTTKDEKIKLSEAIIQQFSAAYMAYLPAYLDMLAEMYGAMDTWHQKRFETKEGRKISAATKDCIKSACDQIMAGHKSLSALIAGDAGESEEADPTSTATAAETKSGPVKDHSAIEQQQINEMKELLKWN